MPIFPKSSRGNHMLVASPETMFGTAFIVDTIDTVTARPIRVLNIDGMRESAMYLDGDWTDLVFGYTELYDVMFEAEMPVRNALMIGGGGFSYPKHLVGLHPEVALDVVEIDQEIIDIAWEFFGLQEVAERSRRGEAGTLYVHCADGREYLERTRRRYDVILNDSFGGAVPAPSLATLEAAAAIKHALVPNGLYMTNVVSAISGKHGRFMRAQANTLCRVFNHVWALGVKHLPMFVRDNYIVIATDSDFKPHRARELFAQSSGTVITDLDNPTEKICEFVDDR